MGLWGFSLLYLQAGIKGKAFAEFMTSNEFFLVHTRLGVYGAGLRTKKE